MLDKGIVQQAEVAAAHDGRKRWIVNTTEKHPSGFPIQAVRLVVREGEEVLYETTPKAS